MEIINTSYAAFERRLLCVCGTNDRRRNMEVLGSSVQEEPIQCGVSPAPPAHWPQMAFSSPTGGMYMVHHFAAVSWWERFICRKCFWNLGLNPMTQPWCPFGWGGGCVSAFTGNSYVKIPLKGVPPIWKHLCHRVSFASPHTEPN